MKLESKTVLITGGAVRLGRAITVALAERGCNVVIHCHRSRRQAGMLASRLRNTGVRAFTVSGDLQAPDDCNRIIDQSFRQAGRLDILINNAAVFHKQSLFSASFADIQAELDVNLIAPFLLIRAFASHARKGSVINLLDRRITSNKPGELTYVLSKKALASLTKMAAIELAPYIRVNAVAPGPVLTSPAHAGTRDKAGFIPLQRKPAVKDLVTAIIFLLECDSVTGQILFVDGGQHLLGSEA